jgi:hypothetical protein
MINYAQPGEKLGEKLVRKYWQKIKRNILLRDFITIYFIEV